MTTWVQWIEAHLPVGTGPRLDKATGAWLCAAVSVGSGTAADADGSGAAMLLGINGWGTLRLETGVAVEAVQAATNTPTRATAINERDRPRTLPTLWVISSPCYRASLWTRVRRRPEGRGDVLATVIRGLRPQRPLTGRQLLVDLPDVAIAHESHAQPDEDLLQVTEPILEGDCY